MFNGKINNLSSTKQNSGSHILLSAKCRVGRALVHFMAAEVRGQQLRNMLVGRNVP